MLVMESVKGVEQAEAAWINVNMESVLGIPAETRSELAALASDGVATVDLEPGPLARYERDAEAGRPRDGVAAHGIRCPSYFRYFTTASVLERTWSFA